MRSWIMGEFDGTGADRAMDALLVAVFANASKSRLKANRKLFVA